MYHVKIFSDWKERSTIEDDINTWLKNMGDKIKIITITQSHGGYQYTTILTITILYQS